MLHDEIIAHLKLHANVINAAIKRGIIEQEGPIFKGIHLQNFDGFISPLIKSNPTAFYLTHQLESLENQAFDSSLVDTAAEFWHEGVLHLPHENCLFIINIETNEETYPILALCSEKEDKSVMIVLLQSSKGMAHEPVVSCAGLFRRGDSFDYIPITEISIERKGQQGIEQLKLLFKTVMTFTLMMNMPHYHQERVTISEKLNKARIKNKKQLLSPYVRISLRPEIRAALSNGSTDAGYSVRPHWRRGHIRTLQDGKKIGVRPCMVNFAGDAELDKKPYLIKT